MSTEPAKNSTPQKTGFAEPVAARRLRAALLVATGVQAVAAAAGLVFYIVELVLGHTVSMANYWMTVAFIVIVLAFLAFSCRAIVQRSGWVLTPLMVWNLCLIPVAWSLWASGQILLAVLCWVLLIASFVASFGLLRFEAAEHRDSQGTDSTGPRGQG